MNDLREYIYTKKPNDEVNLKIIRGKINKEFNIVLGKNKKRPPVSNISFWVVVRLMDVVYVIIAILHL